MDAEDYSNILRLFYFDRVNFNELEETNIYDNSENIINTNITILYKL